MIDMQPPACSWTRPWWLLLTLVVVALCTLASLSMAFVYWRKVQALR